MTTPRVNRNNWDTRLRRLSQGIRESGSSIIIGGTQISGGTSGSILFVSSSGTAGQDPSNLFWDDTNNLLLLGGTSAAAANIILNSAGSAIFNEQGLDRDFRIEGDTNTNLFFVDASTDRIGIGKNNPSVLFDINGQGAATNFSVTDEAYGSSWNGSANVPTKNAVYDKIETLSNTTLASGVYTPTGSNESNFNGTVSLSQAQYMRVGSVVTVSGLFTADPNAAGGTTSFEMTLPISSDLGAVEDLAGAAIGPIDGLSGTIKGVIANNTAQVRFITSDTTSRVWSYIFAYRII